MMGDDQLEISMPDQTVEVVVCEFFKTIDCKVDGFIADLAVSTYLVVNFFSLLEMSCEA